MFKILMKLTAAVMILAAVVSCKEKEDDFGLANIGVGTESVIFTKDGGEQTVMLLSTRNWEAEITSSDGEVDWLTLSPASGSPSSDSVKVVFTALPNTAEDRYATVTFNAGAVKATVSVSQPGETAKQYDAIADVRALYDGENVTITEDWTIGGTVISNYRHANSGGLNNANSQKTVVIQDETAGISLFLVENNEELALGDRVEVKVNGLTLQRYQNGSLQINAVPMDRITRLSSGSQVEPKTISAAELITGDYESQYVAVTDVQVSDADLGKTFVTQDNEGKDRHTSINFISRTGVRFLLYSSSYSTFGDEKVPEGSGILKGIAAVHNGDYQISITSTDDYAGLTGERFDDSGFERPQPTKATIEELLAAPVSGSVWYEITGTISDIESTVYGNFTITDETGSIYVYGLTSEWQADGRNDQSFSELGLKEGDVLTLAGTRDVYNDEPQIGGPAYYISHEEGQGGGDEPEELKEVSIEEFLDAEPGDGIWYQLTGEITDIASDVYGNITIKDETGSVYIYGLTATKQTGGNDKSFGSLGLETGDIVTLATLRDEFGGEPQGGGSQNPAYYISHEEGQGGGDEPDDPTVKEVTIEEFIAAEVSDNVWYQLTGTITNIADDHWGNITIEDETGSVYVYGLTKTKVDKNDNSFSSIGLSEGDIVTLVGTRDEYGGEAQVGGPAYYISHEEGELPETPVLITGTEGDGIYTSSVDLTQPSVNSNDEKWNNYEFTIGGEDYPAIKIGTSSVPGAYSFNLGKSGSCTLTMYAIAWNGKKTHAKVEISGGGTINGMSYVELDCQANSGLAGSDTTLPITFGTKDFYTMSIEDATESTVITVTTDGMANERIGFTGVNVK